MFLARNLLLLLVMLGNFFHAIRGNNPFEIFIRFDRNYRDEKKYGKCKEVANKENYYRVMYSPYENLKHKQLDFGGCYGTVPVIVMQNEINQIRLKEGKELIKFSLSDAFCRGSLFHEGGYAETFFLNIMLGSQSLCLEAEQAIPYKTVVDLYNEEERCPQGPLTNLETDLREMRDKLSGDDFLKEASAKILEHTEGSLCSKPFKLPSMQLHVLDKGSEDDYLKFIKSAIDQGHMLIFNIPGHVIIIAGYTILRCTDPDGKEKEEMLFYLIDPNGQGSTHDADFVSKKIIKSILRDDIGGVSYLSVYQGEEKLKDTQMILGDSRLYHAVSTFDTKRSRQLIKDLIDREGIPVDERSSGRTSLQQALVNKNEGAAKILIEKGANIEAQSDFGNTPLHYAAQYNSLVIANMLIDKGANIHRKNKWGWKPIMTAAFNGNLEIVRLLYNDRTDRDYATNDGGTLIIAAAQAGHLDVVKFLFAKKIDLERKTNKDATPRNYAGTTALFGAAISGQLEVVKYLVEVGADTKTVNASGKTITQEIEGIIKKKSLADDKNDKDNKRARAKLESVLNYLNTLREKEQQ